MPPSGLFSFTTWESRAVAGVGAAALLRAQVAVAVVGRGATGGNGATGSPGRKSQPAENQGYQNTHHFFSASAPIARPRRALSTSRKAAKLANHHLPAQLPGSAFFTASGQGGQLKEFTASSHPSEASSARRLSWPHAPHGSEPAWPASPQQDDKA